MKKIIIKSITIIQIIAMFVLSILPTVMLFNTEVEASIMKEPKGATVIDRNFSDYIISMYEWQGCCYEDTVKNSNVDKQYILLEGVCLNITLDDSLYNESVEVKLMSKDGIEIEEWKIHYEKNFISGGPGQIATKLDGANNTWRINLTKERQQNVIAQYGEGCYWNISMFNQKRFDVHHGKEYLIASYNFKIRSNELYLTKDSKIYGNGLESENCLIENGVLYVKPNAEFNMESKWSLEGRVYGNLTSSGCVSTNTGTGYRFKVNGKVGDKATITWQREESPNREWIEDTKIVMPVVVSNFWSTTNTFTVTSNNTSTAKVVIQADTFLSKKYNNIYNTNRTIVVGTKEAKIKINPCVPEEHLKLNKTIDGLRIDEVVNFCTATPTITAKDSYYELKFTGEKLKQEDTEGLMSVNYKDYKGNQYVEYWKVIVTDNIESYIASGSKAEETPTPDPEQTTDSTTGTGLETGETTPDSTGPTPEITLVSATKASEGKVVYKFKTSNATNVKYAITKRTLKSDGTLNDYVAPTQFYDDFSGKTVSNPGSFEVVIDNNEYESGYYDITIRAKNAVNSRCVGNAWGPNYINYATEINITKTSKTGELDKKYNIDIKETGKDSVKEAYYYIKPTDASGKYIEPSVNDIKTKGTKILNNSADITLSINDGLKSGIYDLVVYAEDSLGKYTVKGLTNIKISNAPIVNFKIDGEKGSSEEGYTFTTEPRNLQKITFNLNDIDSDNTLMVWYVILNEDLTKDGTVTPELLDPANSFTSVAFSAGYKVNSKRIESNSGEIDITISAEEGNSATKYVYLCVQDNLGYFTTISTGKIVVDDTALQLKAIYADKMSSDNQISYKLNDELALTFEFNHVMKEICPDVYLKLGNVERKQDDVKYNGKKITYIYNLNKTNENGELSISKIDYDINTFTDVYGEGNTYKIQVSEDNNVYNLFKERYYLDTVCPTITSAEIILTTGENTKIHDDTVNSKKYLSNLAGAQLKVTYSENVKGKIPQAEMIKGKNKTFKIDALMNSESEGNVYVYDFSTWLYVCKIMGAYDGPIQLNKIINETNFTDIAGNKVDTNIDNVKVKYVLNGTEVKNTEILIDTSVPTAQITEENRNVGNGSIIGVGTQITCFAEYKNNNEQDYKDCVGIKNIKLTIANEGNITELKDKNNTEISNFVMGQDGTTRTYTLTEEQLPVSFSTTKEGKVSVTTYKEDILGNSKEETRVINVEKYIAISEENSGLLELNQSDYYNYYVLSDKQKEYTLALKLDSNITKDQINVKVTDSRDKEISTEYVGQIIINNEEFEQYKFVIDGTGKYNVTVLQKETEMLMFENSVSLKNVYMPGDANADGNIDIMDATVILRYMAGLISTKDNPIVARAGDVNGVNGCRIDDVVVLRRFVAEDPEIICDKTTGYIKIKEVK